MPARRALVAALSVGLLLALASVGGAAEADRVAACGPFTVAAGHSSTGDYALRAGGIRRSPHVPCGRVRKLLKATYGVGPLEVVRTVYPDAGRPTYWLRGGWRCGNGAGGAACWNPHHQRLNVIPVEGSHGLALTAGVRVVRR
jgi:hypothetical protein